MWGKCKAELSSLLMCILDCAHVRRFQVGSVARWETEASWRTERGSPPESPRTGVCVVLDLTDFGVNNFFAVFFVSGSSGWPFYSKSYASSTNFSVCHCHLIVEVADSTSSFSLETNHELCKLCIQPKLNVAYKPIKIMFPPQLKLRSFSLFERRTLHTKYCTCMLMTVTREAIDISSTEPTSYMHRSLTCNGHVPYMQ